MHINNGNEGREAARIRRSDPLDITRRSRESIEQASEARTAERSRAKEEARKARAQHKDELQLSESALRLASADDGRESVIEDPPERIQLLEQLRERYEANQLNTPARIEDAAEGLLLRGGG